MILRFEGVVTTDDEGWGNSTYDPDAILIDGEFVMQDIRNANFNGPVTVAIADQRFTGDLDIDTGLAGYSEYTPGEPSHWQVGGHNIYEYLVALKGQRIVLWIADEPINTLDPAPKWAKDN